MSVKKQFVILLLIISGSAFSSDIDPFKISLGGGYPFGLVSMLNDDFRKAYNQATSAYGSFNTESLTKTAGGSFCTNIGICKNDTTKSVLFGGIFGYSYHGTGKAKYELVDNSVPMTLSVTGKYSVHELRLLPCLLGTSKKALIGGGAGAAYNFVKYTQEGGSSISLGNFTMPQTDFKSSGLTWCIYGFAEIGMIGVEAEVNGLNTFYLGAFLDILYVD
jgi:hypothetical protein